MPFFYLHLRNSVDECLVTEGKEFKDMEALRSAVMFTARDLMIGDLRNGIIDLRFRIDAENEEGQIVYTLPFKHALSIIPQDE